MGPDGLRRRRLRRHLPQLHRQDHEAHQAACPPMGVVAERTVHDGSNKLAATSGQRPGCPIPLPGDQGTDVG